MSWKRTAQQSVLLLYGPCSGGNGMTNNQEFPLPQIAKETTIHCGFAHRMRMVKKGARAIGFVLLILWPVLLVIWIGSDCGDHGGGRGGGPGGGGVWQCSSTKSHLGDMCLNISSSPEQDSFVGRPLLSAGR